jgi:hypothetical protein
MGLLLISPSDLPPLSRTAFFGTDSMISIRLSVPSRQQIGSNRLLPLVAYDLISDHRLARIHRDMFHSDLLLSSATMLVEPLDQARYCSSGPVSKGQISRACLEMFSTGKTLRTNAERV